MTNGSRITDHLARSLHRFHGNTSGTTLVELAIVLPIFLLFFLGLLDFARLGYDYVLAEKAMERAARIATVRPPACAGVPETNQRGTATVVLPYGTACSAGSSICATPTPNPATCQPSDLSNATVKEIWTKIQPLLPYGATVQNLTFTYTFDPDLGFLGGPYVPMVTVEFSGLNFYFLQPINGLANMAGGGSAVPLYVKFAPIRVSLPGEDLAQGNGG